MLEKVKKKLNMKHVNLVTSIKLSSSLEKPFWVYWPSLKYNVNYGVFASFA